MSEKERFEPSLCACLAMDAVGMLSYFMPFVGEIFDVFWALIAAVVFYRWIRLPIGTAVTVGEEILPKTDIVPMFTIAYFVLYGKSNKNKAKLN